MLSFIIPPRSDIKVALPVSPQPRPVPELVNREGIARNFFPGFISLVGFEG